MSKERPRKVIDLSVLHLDTTSGLQYTPNKADDPEVIAMRQSWPRGTVILAQQNTGAVIAHEIASFNFIDKDARSYTFGVLATALVNSAWHTYPEKSQSIMRSVVDLPQLAADPQFEGDESAWRETEEGSLDKLRRGLAFTATSAYKLFDLHRSKSTGEKYNYAARRFSRNAAGNAIRMATLGLLNDQTDERSAIDIQNNVRTIGLSLLDETRYAHETYGNHPTLAQLADDPRATWLANAPDEAVQAFNSAFEQIE